MNKIKKRLKKANGKWVEKFPSLLWVYRMLRKAKNEVPYSLVFDFEVVISLEAELPTIQIEAYDDIHKDEVLASDLDLAKERRENTLIRMTNYNK